MLAVALAAAGAACDATGGPPVSGTGAPAGSPISERAAVVAAHATLRAAVASLLAADAMEIEVAFSGSAGDGEGEIRVDRVAVALDSVERTRFEADAPVIVSELVLVSGTLHARIYQDVEDPAVIPWAAIPVEDQGATLVNEAYVAYGRIAGSLDDLVRLIEAVPGDVIPLAERSDNGRSLVGHAFVFDAENVARVVRELGLATAVSEDVHGETRFETWLADGMLVELRASGTQFHDGEAIEDLFYVIRYREVGAAPIAPPSVVR